MYLTTIQLRLEQGFSDPTSDEILHLMCDSYKMMEIAIPIALLPLIYVLHTLKIQPSGFALYASLEQCLLWAAFSLAFYGSIRVIEFTSPSSSNSFSPPRLH